MSDIDSDVQEFLQRSLRSVWTLELLLMLHRRPTRTWTDASLVREMRASQTVVSEAIAILVGLGLVARAEDGRIGYRALSPLNAIVERICALHAQRPVAVTQAIHGGATAKIQTFADSFKLRKD
jgi:hypothetical protein